MESITIDFLDTSPDGIRLLRSGNWAGACVVVARDALEPAQRLDELTYPGVYILAAPLAINGSGHPASVQYQIYIGRSDALGERLQQHYAGKNFWSTAFAFYRAGGALHAGQLSQLEAFLIDKAQASGTHVVLNAATPRQTMSKTESEFVIPFAAQIESMLKVLGLDFFSLPRAAEPTEVKRESQGHFAVPQHLQTLVDLFRESCLEKEAVDLYTTKVPDVRARVTHDGQSRVFATIRLLKNGVRLWLSQEGEFVLHSANDFGEVERQALGRAYLERRSQLTRTL